MPSRALSPSTIAAASLAALLLAGSSRAALACSCLPFPTVDAQLAAATDAFTLVIVGAQEVRGQVGLGGVPRLRRGVGRGTGGDEDTRWAARVEAVYKGCLRAGQRVVLVTPRDEGRCGVPLVKGQRITVAKSSSTPLASQRREIRVGLCDLLSPAPEELGSLALDAGCCGRPCTPARCRSDAACGIARWCRPIAAGGSSGTCTPFAGPGEPCGGYQPPWSELRCAPGLECERLGDLPDLPGVCR